MDLSSGRISSIKPESDPTKISLELQLTLFSVVRFISGGSLALPPSVRQGIGLDGIAVAVLTRCWGETRLFQPPTTTRMTNDVVVKQIVLFTMLQSFLGIPEE